MAAFIMCLLNFCLCQSATRTAFLGIFMAFCMDCQREHKQFVVGDVMGKGLAEKKLKKGDVVYNWLPYAKNSVSVTLSRFGTLKQLASI